MHWQLVGFVRRRKGVEMAEKEIYLNEISQINSALGEVLTSCPVNIPVPVLKNLTDGMKLSTEIKGRPEGELLGEVFCQMLQTHPTYAVQSKGETFRSLSAMKRRASKSKTALKKAYEESCGGGEGIDMAQMCLDMAAKGYTKVYEGDYEYCEPAKKRQRKPSGEKKAAVKVKELNKDMEKENARYDITRCGSLSSISPRYQKARTLLRKFLNEDFPGYQWGSAIFGFGDFWGGIASRSIVLPHTPPTVEYAYSKAIYDLSWKYVPLERNAAGIVVKPGYLERDFFPSILKSGPVYTWKMDTTSFGGLVRSDVKADAAKRGAEKTKLAQEAERARTLRNHLNYFMKWLRVQKGGRKTGDSMEIKYPTLIVYYAVNRTLPPEERPTDEVPCEMAGNRYCVLFGVPESHKMVLDERMCLPYNEQGQSAMSFGLQMRCHMYTDEVPHILLSMLQPFPTAQMIGCTDSKFHRIVLGAALSAEKYYNEGERISYACPRIDDISRATHGNILSDACRLGIADDDLYLPLNAKYGAEDRLEELSKNPGPSRMLDDEVSEFRRYCYLISSFSPVLLFCISGYHGIKILSVLIYRFQ